MRKTSKKTALTQLKHYIIISFINFVYILVFPKFFLSHMIKSPTINPMYRTRKKIEIIFTKDTRQYISCFRNITNCTFHAGSPD